VTSDVAVIMGYEAASLGNLSNENNT